MTRYADGSVVGSHGIQDTEAYAAELLEFDGRYDPGATVTAGGTFKAALGFADLRSPAHDVGEYGGSDGTGMAAAPATDGDINVSGMEIY